jgi:hypothetical protein
VSLAARTVLAKLLDQTLAKLRDQQLIHGKLSLLIGYTAAAKVLMAYWGPSDLASGIETLAKMDSASRYKALVGGPLCASSSSTHGSRSAKRGRAVTCGTCQDEIERRRERAKERR